MGFRVGGNKTRAVHRFDPLHVILEVESNNMNVLMSMEAIRVPLHTKGSVMSRPTATAIRLQ